MFTVPFKNHNKKTVFKVMPLLGALVFVEPFYQFIFMVLGIFKSFVELRWKNRGFMVKRNSEELKILFGIFCFGYGFNSVNLSENLFHSLCAPEIIPAVCCVLKDLLLVQFL